MIHQTYNFLTNLTKFFYYITLSDFLVISKILSFEIIFLEIIYELIQKLKIASLNFKF